SARGVTWINPMLRYEHYESRALGPSVIERYAQHLVSGHNLESLCGLFDVDRPHRASPAIQHQ
ncbi:MAG TPA: hypothetical protein VK973_18600, partial [Arenicellales bacterium]|nr:hypothetical protein [Arenicellales bacterium]